MHTVQTAVYGRLLSLTPSFLSVSDACPHVPLPARKMKEVIEKMTGKTTRRALLTSALAILACVAMLVGTTFAWFTDTASTAANTIRSGILTVDIVGEDGVTSLQNKSMSFVNANGSADILWEPGVTFKTPVFQIKNTGNLALKYKLAINGITGDNAFLRVIHFSVMDAEGKEVSLDTFEGHLTPDAALSGALYIQAHMDENAGNEYQDKTLSGLGITVIATQDTVEYDSKDNQYDKDASYGEKVTSAEEFKAALADGKTILLANDIALTAELHINKDVTVFGNGHTVISGAPVRVDAGHSVTFKNVTFSAPQNAKNNASNFYAAGLKGKLVLDGCKFLGTQYDCVQVVPETGAEIVINGCRFEADKSAERFIHIEAAYASNADVKITLTNNFFGATGMLKNSMIDLDYINLAGIDFGGNNIYTDTNGDIYVCGPSVNRTISKADAYAQLGALKAADNEEIKIVTGDIAITEGNTATIAQDTKISAGATISGSGTGNSTLNSDNAKISEDNVTIKDITIKGSGSAGTGGTLNIGGNNAALENVDYQGDGNIAITVSTGSKNSGTTFKKVKITKAFRGIQFWSLSGDSVIDDCVLNVAGYTFNIDAAVAGSTLTIKDSTLNGWTSYTSGIKLVSFDNCKLGLNAYQYLRPYSETKLTDCEFTSAGYQLNAGGSDAYTITLTNCTKNGTPITAENVKALLLDTDDWNTNATLIVNGVTVTL